MNIMPRISPVLNFWNPIWNYRASTTTTKDRFKQNLDSWNPYNKLNGISEPVPRTVHRQWTFGTQVITWPKTMLILFLRRAGTFCCRTGSQAHFQFVETCLHLPPSFGPIPTFNHWGLGHTFLAATLVTLYSRFQISVTVQARWWH